MPLTVSRAGLLKSRLSRFTRVLPDLEKGDVRSLHRARVASRRLRELVPVLQVDADAARKLGRRLRKITARLGRVRELDVLLGLIDELRASQPVHQDALRRVGAAVAKSRDAARKRLPDDLSGELYRLARKLERLLRDLKQSDKSQSDKSPSHGRAVRWAIEARVARRAARLLAAIEDAGGVYLPERLHGVRISLKKLRYAVELLEAVESTRGTRRSPVVGALKREQDVLGRMHDLQVLIDRVRAVQALLAPPDPAVWHQLDALVVSLDESCRRLHGRYIHDRQTLSAIASRLAVVSARQNVPARGVRRAG